MVKIRILLAWIYWSGGRVLAKSPSHPKARFNPEAVRRYLEETTVEGYRTKTGNHSHFKSEGENLRSGNGWSDRIEELSLIIPGGRILEMGSAEGILASKLASIGNYCVGAEISRFRHQSAVEILRVLSKDGLIASNLKLVNKDVTDEDWVFSGFDSFVAARVIYHFRSLRELKRLFARIASEVEWVFLLGDRKKSIAYESFGVKWAANPTKFFYFASQAGMSNLLESFGYQVTAGTTSWGDPYVTGRKRASPSHESILD